MAAETGQDMNQELEQLCWTPRRLLLAGLLDFSGGNLSVRSGDSFFVTPRYAGEKFGWELSVDDLVEVSLVRGLVGIPEAASRETRMHYELYRLRREFSAVLHSHQKDLLTFACARKPLAVASELEGMEVNEIPLAEPAPAGSRRLAESVCRTVGKHFGSGSRAAVLVPSHGTVVAAESLPSAVCLLAGIANAAYVEIARGAARASEHGHRV